MQKTAAWPLAAVYALLIAYASLFPFENWRYQGAEVFAFLSAPMPKYWTGFDVGVNILGYIPMGFLATWAMLRRHRAGWSLLFASLLTACLSVLMETLQGFLPTRVPSNLDALLNASGGMLGALIALAANGLGLLAYWSRFKQGWFDAEPRGALVLLALWPLALIYPAALPFGLGQVAERLLEALARLLAESPFKPELPRLDNSLLHLSFATEWACIFLGLMAPSLLAYSVIGKPIKRWCATLLIGAVGLTMTAASSALSFGPEHAWEWVTPASKSAVMAQVLIASSLLWLTKRGSLVLLLLAMVLQLNWINNAPMSAYLTETLNTWEQGRFARFNGLAQWLGWVWPYALVLYASVRLSRQESRPAPA